MNIPRKGIIFYLYNGSLTEAFTWPLFSWCKVKTFLCRLHEIIVSFFYGIPKYRDF